MYRINAVERPALKAGENATNHELLSRIVKPLANGNWRKVSLKRGERRSIESRLVE
jgi:hypothetical protein